MTATGNDRAWYEALYLDFEGYDDAPYARHTEAEVNFIQTVIGRDRDLYVLDVGCGTGRHSLELARRGYRHLTGLDLSPSMLEQARAKAAAARLEVAFIQKDARQLDFQEVFDVVLLLCEGGFSLVETDEMDRQILQGVARALRPGGTLIMTAPNAAFMLARADEDDGFDPVTLREQFTLEKNGQELVATQRYYTFPELKWLLSAAGCEQIAPFAVGEEGYRQDRMPAKDDYEFGVTAVEV